MWITWIKFEKFSCDLNDVLLDLQIVFPCPFKKFSSQNLIVNICKEYSSNMRHIKTCATNMVLNMKKKNRTHFLPLSS